MRAVVIHAPKDLRIDTYPDAAPAAGEVRVRNANGGICGSDLHYYHHGGFGVVRIQQPMALGHEIAGVVETVGDGVSGVKPGTRVAVNPSKPCGQCQHCQEGMRNQCLDMRFLGSAMRFPHVQGGFREFITVDAAQAMPIADKLSLAEVPWPSRWRCACMPASRPVPCSAGAC
jgi:L-idonate 5-dehydrogenase